MARKLAKIIDNWPQLMSIYRKNMDPEKLNSMKTRGQGHSKDKNFRFNSKYGPISKRRLIEYLIVKIG